ncbi:MAG: acyltransferase [Candidatus Aegiribacteria sp.]|nr:acyltransferase [Candidatus Aegiribacteria sp.]MBD3295722.1 acyltransferase [Candidatus Fermentibacteria bacterium]
MPDVSFKVGYFQFSPVFGKVRRNHAVILSALSGVEADLMVLPELPLTGYGFRNREELLSLAGNPQESEYISDIARLCGRSGMHVVTGFAEREGTRVFNSAILVGPAGIKGVYRKLHLFDREKLYFDPGDLPLRVYDVNGLRIGMMVCFDWIFPEVARTLTIAKADVLCHPANLVLDHCQRAMTVRCTENMVYSITANRTGTEEHSFGNLSFTGKSQILAPGGDVLKCSNGSSEETALVEIDVSVSRNKFITDRNHVLEDRRPEFYRRDGS